MSSLVTRLSGTKLPTAMICTPISELSRDGGYPVRSSLLGWFMASRRSGKADSLRLVRNVDPAAIAMRLQDGIGNHLRRQSMIEAGHGLSALDNRRDEFPHQVVAKHCCWLACRQV